MSKWADPIQEFHQLVTPDGQVYDLTAPSRQGRWVLNSQGWGMPGVEWLTQQTPFQHGSSVLDYRLQPRVLQLMVRQNFCKRDDYWSGRQALIDAVRPNRTPIAFRDYWTPRSQYQGGGSYPLGADQTSITDLEAFNGLLYGSTGEDGSGTGGLLMVWDGAGAWVNADGQASAHDAFGNLRTAQCINCLAAVTMDTPIFEVVRSGQSYECSHTAGDDTDLLMNSDIVWYGQAFIPDEDCYLSDIQVRLWQSGLTGKVWCYFYEGDGTGKPTGDPLTMASMDADHITAAVAGGWVFFGDQGAPEAHWTVEDIALTAGQQYVAVIWADEAEAAKTLNWRAQAGAGPAGEETVWSADGGTSWAAVADHTMFVMWKQGFANTKTGEREDRPLLLAGCSKNFGIVVPWDGEWLHDMGAIWFYVPNIYDILQWTKDGKVYCAGGQGGDAGDLCRYEIDMTTGEGSLTSVCAEHANDHDTRCLAAYDDGTGSHIYGGTDDGRLLKWDGTDGTTWLQICAATGAETIIHDLLVHNGALFGCTGPNGYLVRYDVAGGHWDVVTGAAGQAIRTLQSWRGRLYGAGVDGHLYRWNDSNAWEVILHEYTGEGSAEEVLSSIIYDNRFMVGTQDGAYLLEWMHERTYSVPQCTVLRRLLSNGQKRDLCVFIAEGPQFDPDEPGWDEFAFTEMLRFIAYNPVMFDPAVQIETYLLGTGSISEYEDITYPGTWETHPTLVLTGPLTNPQVLNETIDEFIQLAYEIPDGDVVTIDLENGTVLNQDNLNLIGTVTAESSLATFRLVPNPEATGGVNRIRLVAAEAGANSDFEVQYFNRYIGI